MPAREPTPDPRSDPPAQPAGPPISVILPPGILIAVHALALVLTTRRGLTDAPDLYGIYNMAAGAGTILLLAYLLRKDQDPALHPRLRSIAWMTAAADLLITLALTAYEFGWF